MVFFLWLSAQGMWIPAMSNILSQRDMAWVIPYAFAVAPFASIFSPLIFGALADQKVQAQKLVGALGAAGGVTLALSFASLQYGWGGAWFFLSMQGLTALISAPMGALIASIAMSNFSNPDRQFPLCRTWGTVGWIVGGLIVSALMLDQSAYSGMLAAGFRFLMGLSCLMMPVTVPEGKKSNDWRDYLGLKAVVMFKQRDLRVFLITTVLLSIPLSAFYMYTAPFLVHLGSATPSANMTIGQGSEIFALLALGWISKGKIRLLFLVAMGAAVVQYSLFVAAGINGGLAAAYIGISMHGPCFAFFFITGQMFVNRRVSGELRTQAQALITVLANGVGAVMGSLVCGWYFASVAGLSHHWLWFWGGLAVMVLACGVYFLIGFRRDESEDGGDANVSA
ncbi:MFS transporter [Persicirhabdus sediminis]|uniref:MFS transporter n=1 Tax=Persicirhabdus sediminis TaxID=454144 RepID=A0A8J7SK60_9BACT|nr:MFS transporter [Persicirhabdus sediminis]